MDIKLEQGLSVAPIACQPDRAAVYILGNTHLQLSEQEELSLLEEINAYLQEEQLHLQRIAPLQWFLPLSELPNITTHALNDVIGKDVWLFLPQGPDQQRWHRLFIEIQMLLQRCKVNVARAEQGLPTVDGIWFWREQKQPWWKRIWK